MSKREFLGAPLLAALGMTARAAVSSRTTESERDCAPLAQPDYDLPLTAGPFAADMQSLQSYRAPDWFRDAKFGIWAHWGPQSVARAGDWYARQMYVPGHPHYDHHLKTFGHPSRVGYKDIIPLWTAEKFDPEGLMDRYAAAGARYFVSMGVHHDNFDLWASRHHRWNAVAMGPKRDIVGAWKKAALARGLRFGVSEHLGASHNWFYPSHLYDQFWPLLGRDYDGADPSYADLYHPRHDEPYRNTPDSWYTHDPNYHQIWFNRIRDLLDSYEPDLLYSDGGLPFGVVGRSLVANFYNTSIARHGRLEAVYNCKALGSGEFDAATCVQDVERGVLKGIEPLPWQTDSSNGDWFYSDGDHYKTTDQVLHLLADVVSKNGNLLLNVVLYPDGGLPPQSAELLDSLAGWMRVNSEAIHGTRPWKVFGEGPTQTAEGAFKEGGTFSAQDIRFTTRGKTLYAITLGEPGRSVAIMSLGRRSTIERRPVLSVQMLGNPRPLSFRHTDEALVVDLPEGRPTKHASAFRIFF
jgi:alpha-L-fucosidase